VLGLGPFDVVPPQQAGSPEWAGIFAQARQSVILALGGTVAIFGFLLSYFRHRREERSTQVQMDQAKLQGDQHWTRRYTDAISQLGDSGSLSTRLGGIYALERLAKDAPSPSDRGTIAAVLAAHLREYSPRVRTGEDDEYLAHLYRRNDEVGESDVGRESEGSLRAAVPVSEQDLESARKVRVEEADTLSAQANEAQSPRSVTDLKAAVEALGRITTFGPMPSPVDLTDTDLLGANLNGANLRGALLFRANMFAVSLVNADLSGANLAGSVLNNALLVGANLREAEIHDASLANAHLDDSDLTGAELSRSALVDVYISGAVFTDANLSFTMVRAYDYVPGQFDDIGGWDDNTELPPGSAPKVPSGTLPAPPMHG
jgi:hypothetical protein